MSDPESQRAVVEAELERTKFQRKVVSYDDLETAATDAIAYFKERGYRSGKTGRPNQVFVMGGREGVLPRVTAEILIQVNVGKGKVTMLSISGAGEELSKVLADFADHVREKGRETRKKRADT